MTTEPSTPAARVGFGKLIDSYGRRLAKYQFAAGALDLQQSVSTLTRRGLTVLLILAVSGLAGFLPGADIALFRGITIAILLKFGAAVAVLWLLFTAYQQAACALGHFVRAAFHLPPGDMTHHASAVKLAWNGTLLAYVCLTYWVFIRALSSILAAFTIGRWPFLVLDLGSLAAALVAIIGIFVAISPLFGKVGDLVARHVGPATEDTPQSKCPKCGVFYYEGSRYCSFCGEPVSRTPQNADMSHAHEPQ